MRITRIRLSVSYNSGIDRAQVIDNFRDELVEMQLISSDYPAGLSEYHGFDLMVTSDQVVELMHWANASVALLDESHTYFIPGFIHELAAKVDKKPERFPEMDPYHQDFNQLVNVYTPGNTLSVFNELMLSQDACTDSIQRDMREGWRIVAVCPQPDQRRPDYIMGRYNPDRDNAKDPRGALRPPSYVATDVPPSNYDNQQVEE